MRLAISEAIKTRRKKLAQDEKHITELDRLYIKVYEVNAAGLYIAASAGTGASSAAALSRALESISFRRFS